MPKYNKLTWLQKNTIITPPNPPKHLQSNTLSKAILHSTDWTIQQYYCSSEGAVIVYGIKHGFVTVLRNGAFNPLQRFGSAA